MGITGTDLEQWAGRLQASSDLPALLRRLVLATSTAQISMRAGEGTRLSGFDGLVVQDTPHPYLPLGTSVWEMGVNANRRAKAEADYQTRTENPLTVDPATTTFVFVTPRRWQDKDQWAADKKAENQWLDVRVLDADDLEGWLSMAPAVEGWLAPRLGLPSQGVRSPEQFWADWAGVTEPQLTPAVVLAGWNEDPAAQLKAFLQGKPTAAGIRAEAPVVAAAFLAAFLLEEGESHERDWARTLFVDEATAWNTAVMQGSPSILVPLFEHQDHTLAAVRKGHHVVVPLGRKETGRKPDLIQLDRQRRRDLREALNTLGLPDAQADRLATVGRRSLLSLRRALSVLPAVHRPPWIERQNVDLLMGPVMAGSWHMNHEGDQEALSHLSGRPYPEVEQSVVQLAQENDPPLRRTGGVWMVTSREDSWALVAPLITTEHLQRWARVVYEVLGEKDPMYDLPEEKWYMAQVLGKKRKHSDLLREELADGLALMGARSDSTNWSLLDPPQVCVDRWVRQLLSTQESVQWLSMAWVLPKLAEAAPEVFLSRVEEALSTQLPPLQDLFQDRQDRTDRMSSAHTSLLWALEGLAWSPDHLIRVAVALARLAQVDPGGTLSNRPLGSLQTLLVSWYRNTRASVQEKLEAVDAVRFQVPEIGWSMMLGLLPKDYGFVHPTHQPTWRDWGQEQGARVTVKEHWEMVQGLILRVIEDAQNHATRLMDVLQNHDNLTDEQLEKAIEALEVATITLSEAEKEPLWDQLLRFIARQREFPDAHWSLDEKHLQKLDQIQHQVAPQDLVCRYLWLFEMRPPLGVRWDHDGIYQDTLQVRRTQALQDILSQKGISGILEALQKMGEDHHPWVLGHQMTFQNAPELLSPAWLHGALQLPLGHAFVAGVLLGRLQHEGRDALEAWWGKSDFGGWSAAQRAVLLHSFPADFRTWKLMEQQEAALQQPYWQTFNWYNLNDREPTIVKEAVERLLQHARPAVAFDLLCHTKLNLPAASWLQLLIALLQQEPELLRERSYHIKKKLNELVDHPEMDLLQLAHVAWAYLPFYPFEEPPKAITRVLLSDAQQYVELIKTAFPDGETRSNQEDTDRFKQEVAFRVLWKLRGVPGSSPEGVLEQGRLLAWVQEVRNAPDFGGRQGLVDSLIGQLLASAPARLDGQWPPPEVCNVIEQVASSALEDGFRIGRSNLRGPTMRALDAGGAQERQLAATYLEQARQLQPRWPRTAQCLRQLARDYEDDARRHDDDSDLTQDRWH